MRILYFHQHFSTLQGATGTRSYYFAKGLIARGHDVTVVCGKYDRSVTGIVSSGSEWREELVDGIRVVQLPYEYSNHHSFLPRTLTFLRYSFACIWIVLTRKHDVVFATSTPLTAAIPGIVAKWLYRKRFVFEVRDLWPELPKAMGVISNPIVLGAMSLLEKLAYLSADQCIGLAPGICDGIRKKANTSVKMIPNGCDPELVKAYPQWRQNGEKVTAIYAGTLGYANGLETVLDAASVLGGKNYKDNVEIVFVGDGAVKKQLEMTASERKLTNVRFLPPLPHDQLFEYLSQCQIGIMPLRNVPAFYYGTSPNKFFDYLVAGLPIVNNYPGWVADMLTREEAGFVVAPESPEALASAIEFLMNDEGAWTKASENARNLSRQFSKEIQTEQFVRVIESV